MTQKITPTDAEFDFVRYFTRVQMTPFWHDMQLGMADFAGVRPGMRVLDLGCGPGRLVDHLQSIGIEAIGADGDARMIAQARQLFPGRPFQLTSAEKLPWPDDHFDATLAGNLLFFLRDPLIVLREMARVTQPGGWVTLWNPSEQISQTAAAQYAANQHEWDNFAQKHLVNWAGVAENNQRWAAPDLQQLFTAAHLTHFTTQTTLGGLARYAKGRKSKEL
jgi:ubiquinone/menaquinone biosynthesis C-methylase UbiE